jgi:molecular chaperone DnaK
MEVVGIDLGTTNSVSAVAGRAVSTAEDGSCALPSVVAFLPNGHTMVGRGARRRRAIDFENTIWSAKRIMGRRFQDSTTASFRERYRFSMIEGEDGEPLFATRTGNFSPTEIASKVLSEIAQWAELSAKETQVNVTIPAMFGPAQREATSQAAVLAGIPNVHLVSESTAAAFAYRALGIELGTALVYDLGGGTFDCAILDCTEEVPSLLSHASDLFLGGDDIDQNLAAWVTRYVLEKHNWDLTNYSEITDRLVARCEEAKIALSSAEEATVELSQVDPECPAASEGVKISRRILDRLCENLVRRTFLTCDEALSRAGMQPPNIDTVILAGGTTMLPMIQSSVSAYFGKEGLLRVDPTFVVAQGASLAPVGEQLD